MSLQEELEARIAVLEHAGWEEITRRVSGLVKWMKEEDRIEAILRTLRSGPVYERLNFLSPGREREVVDLATTPENIAAVGLAMMERCAVLPDHPVHLHQIAHSFGIRATPNHSAPHIFQFEAALKRYIHPLLNYVKQRLATDQGTASAASSPPTSAEELALNATQKGINNPKHDIAPANEDKGTGGTWFDTIFAALELLALVLWMLAEVFHHQIWTLYVVCLSLAAGCFLAGITYLVNKRLNHAKILWLAWCVLTFLFALTVFVFSNPVENSSTPSKSTNSEPRVAVQVLAEKLEATSDQLAQARKQQDEMNKALIAAQSATEPRIISPQQREKFIKILTNINNVSKINISVILGGTDDPERGRFASAFREMLTEAGYGTNGQPVEIIPDFHIISGHFGANEEVIVIIADTNEFDHPLAENGVGIGGYVMMDDGTNVYHIRGDSLLPYSVFPMFYGTNAAHMYKATQNPNDIIRGLATVLVQEIGISVGKVPANGILKPSNAAAFFIPPKLY